MSSARLHLAPEGAGDPYPLTCRRLVHALNELGYPTERHPGSNRVDFEADAHQLRAYWHPGKDILAIQTRWDSEHPYRSAEYALFAAADNWNRESYFPTVYLLESPDHTALVVADMIAPCSMGLSDRQLSEYLDTGVTQGLRAMNYIRSVAERMLGLGHPHHG